MKNIYAYGLFLAISVILIVPMISLNITHSAPETAALESHKDTYGDRRYGSQASETCQAVY